MGSARPLQCQLRPTSRTASLLGSSSGGPRQNLSACLHPLLRFHSPTEFDQLALPPDQLSPEPGRLPWDFLSLRRLRAGASAGPAVASDLANSPGVTVLYRVLSATGLAHHGFSATPPVSALPDESSASLLGSSSSDRTEPIGLSLSSPEVPLSYRV
jgi:hypothetical protein